MELNEGTGKLTEEMLIKACRKMREKEYKPQPIILHPKQHAECEKRGWIKDGQLDWKKIAEDINDS